MENDSFREPLLAAGFRRIGALECDLRMTLWWHADHRLEVAVVDLAPAILLRATRHYRLLAMGEGGETYARDLAALNEYLGDLFPEVHIHLSHYADITPTLARRRIAEKGFRQAPSAQAAGDQDPSRRLAEITSAFVSEQDAIHRSECLHRLNQGRSSLLQRHLQEQVHRSRQRMGRIQAEAKGIQDRTAVQGHLEREYLQKGTATCVLFTCASNALLVRTPGEFADALASVVKELLDIDRFQIRQKLQGGRLQVFVEKVDAPGIHLLTRWTGASLCPRQLDRWGQEYADIREAVEDQFMVLPRQDILMGGAVKDEKKLVAARVIRDLLDRLPKVPSFQPRKVESPRGLLPVWIGTAESPAGGDGGPWELPLDKAQHTILSGRTGSGKSFMGRVIVEGAAAHKDLAILVLDPRNQWVSIVQAEDRSEILARYREFGMETQQARGLDFVYHSPGLGLGRPLPRNLRELASGRRVLSFNGMDDESRCGLCADCLEAVLDACAASESGCLRELVVIEEVPRFIRRGVDEVAARAAQRVDQAIDRIAREGRKYGVFLLLIAQSYRDLAYNLATVRQNVSTRCFLQNSDLEVQHADQHMPDGRAIAELAPGQAYVCNPLWGVVKVRVRPPLSKVWQPPDGEVETLMGRAPAIAFPALSASAEAVLDAVVELYAKTGQPVRLSAVTDRLGITSRRQIERLVDELQQASAVKFQRLPERGRPLVVVPNPVRPVHEPHAQTRPGTGANGGTR